MWLHRKTHKPLLLLARSELSFPQLLPLCSSSEHPQEHSEQEAGWSKGDGVQCLSSPLAFPAGRH